MVNLTHNTTINASKSKSTLLEGGYGQTDGNQANDSNQIEQTVGNVGGANSSSNKHNFGGPNSLSSQF